MSIRRGEDCIYKCIEHNYRCVQYGDGAIWCDIHGRALRENEILNTARGKESLSTSPSWKKIDV